MKMKAVLVAAILALVIFGATTPTKVVVADGGPILVCPPGKTHDECQKHNPLPPL